MPARQRWFIAALGLMVGAAIALLLRDPPGRMPETAPGQAGPIPSPAPLPALSPIPRIPHPAPRKQGAPTPAAPIAFPSAQGEPREFRTLSDSERPAWDEAVRDFWRATDNAARSAILDRIETDFYVPEIVGLVGSMLGMPPGSIAPEIRLKALELLAGNIAPEILPALELARSDADESVRAASLLAAGQVRDPGLIRFLQPAIEDASPAVRLAILRAVEDQTVTAKQTVFGMALKSSHADLAEAALGELEVDARPSTVPLIIEGLNTPDAAIREEVRFALEFLFDREFESADEALKWWGENRHRYDDDLVPTDP
jgi:hypothetical protein